MVNNKDEDVFFMRAALTEARRAFARGEVPVGAVIVRRGRIIGRGHNLVEKKRCALQHAEMTAIGRASIRLKNWRLAGCTLYTSVEPCAMCSAALLLARVERVVFGAGNHLPAAQGGPGALRRIMRREQAVRGGVLADEAAELLREFFRKQRTK